MYKNEINRLKKEFTKTSEQLNQKSRLVKTEADDYYGSVELIKDVESMILDEAEPIQIENMMKHSMNKIPTFVKNIILPDDFKGSSIPDKKGNAQNQLNERFDENEMKKLANPNGIYQLFYHNMMQTSPIENQANKTVSTKTHDVHYSEKVHRVLGFEIKQDNNDPRVFQKPKQPDIVKSSRGVENRPSFVNLKVDQPISIRGIKPSTIRESEQSENRLFRYITFPSESVYNDPFYLMLLRNASLLPDFPIFENEAIKINCQTESNVSDKFVRIDLKLIFIPKVSGLNLSTYLESTENIVCEPQVFKNRIFESKIAQKFSLCFFQKSKLVDFPTLKVTLKLGNSLKKISAYLPFSINKYMSEIGSKNLIQRIIEQVE